MFIKGNIFIYSNIRLINYTFNSFIYCCRFYLRFISHCINNNNI